MSTHTYKISISPIISFVLLVLIALELVDQTFFFQFWSKFDYVMLNCFLQINCNLIYHDLRVYDTMTIPQKIFKLPLQLYISIVAKFVFHIGISYVEMNDFVDFFLTNICI